MKTIEIKPQEFGLEPKQANELIGNLPSIIEERKVFESQYEEIKALDIEDEKTAKKARALRLKIRDNRTKGLNVWHKTTKDFFLKGGQFVDAIKRKEIAVNERMESDLEQIEKYAEIKEQKRLDELENARLEKLEPYKEFVPFGANIRTISDEDFEKLFNGAKLQYDTEQERLRKEQKEQERLQRIQKLHNERKENLLDVWSFVEDKTINFGELDEDVFGKICSDAYRAKSEHEAEQKRIREENERLAKEKAKAEADAAKEREKANQEIKKRQKSASEFLMKSGFEFTMDYGGLYTLSIGNAGGRLYLVSYKQSNLYFETDSELERFIEAALDKIALVKKEFESAKNEDEKIESERKAKEEAEKLAKAPVKEQLHAWIETFEINVAPVENEVSDEIIAKFGAFKHWAAKQVENL